jgi:peroxiredoxin
MRFFLLIPLLVSSLFAAGDMVGHRAPGFSLPDREFRYHDPQDYRGKVLLVEFMQTACPHCMAFSKILEEAAAKYEGKVAVLSIVNPPDSPDNVARYVAATKVTTPVLFDCGQIAASYIHWTPGTAPAFDLPRLFIIDPGGVIRRDLEYSLLTREVFEGRGLFAEVDKVLADYAAASKK